MKVFFDTSYRRTEAQEKHYAVIYKCIEEMGYKHLYNEIMEGVNSDKTGSAIGAEDRQERTKYIEMYKKRLHYLHQSDINVFEATIPSLSTGLLIEKSLDMNKPTLVFYYKKNTPVLISGIEDEKLILAEYDDGNIAQVVRDTINKTNQIRDKRFNFFISPTLLEYLERKSKENGITKSTFIRRLILKHMKSNSSL